MFLESTAVTLETWTFDHNPIIMTVVEKGRGLRYKRRTFPQVHYEDLWSSYDKWSHGNAVECLMKTTKESMIQLQMWRREELGDRRHKVEKLIQELKELNQRNQHYEDVELVKKLEKHIDGLFLEQEIYWKQRSIADWLHKGDKNTKFFYAKASSRKRKNKI